jgi:predicted TIM-barrel fold metal-dependent hydrolase
MSAPNDTATTRLPWPVFSSDCHVIEPPDLWIARVDKRFRDRAPRVVRYEDTELWIVDDEKRLAVVGIQAQAGRRFQNPSAITKRGFYADIPELTPSRYLEGLDKDGVRGAVMFSSNAHQAFRVVTGELLTVIANTFNDWILDYCAHDTKRLKPVAIANIDDVDEGVAEMRRTVARGAAAVMIPILPLPGRRYDQPEYDRLWSAAVDLDVPLIFHVGANQAVVDREPMIDLVRHGMKDLHVQGTVATLVLSGVFARHPTLRVGVVEFEGSWSPYLLDQMDRVYETGARAAARLPAGELPSDHFRRNLFVSFQEDPAVIRLREHVGVDNVCWGSDYPHAESTYPRSHEILAGALRGVPSVDAAKIVGANTARIFGFDLPGWDRSPAD